MKAVQKVRHVLYLKKWIDDVRFRFSLQLDFAIPNSVILNSPLSRTKIIFPFSNSFSIMYYFKLSALSNRRHVELFLVFPAYKGYSRVQRYRRLNWVLSVCHGLSRSHGWIIRNVNPFRCVLRVNLAEKLDSTQTVWTNQFWLAFFLLLTRLSSVVLSMSCFWCL